MHVALADALENSCRRFSGRHRRACYTGDAARQFVIVGTERTGTNLLIGMLRDCCAGGELFNSENIRKGIIPWPEIAEANRTELLALRKSDPHRVLEGSLCPG